MKRIAAALAQPADQLEALISGNPARNDQQDTPSAQQPTLRFTGGQYAPLSGQARGASLGLGAAGAAALHFPRSTTREADDDRRTDLDRECRPQFQLSDRLRRDRRSAGRRSSRS